MGGALGVATGPESVAFSKTEPKKEKDHCNFFPVAQLIHEWVAMKPKRCVTAPKGDSKSLEEMSGDKGRVPRASSLRYSLPAHAR